MNNKIFTHIQDKLPPLNKKVYAASNNGSVISAKITLYNKDTIEEEGRIIKKGDICWKNIYSSSRASYYSVMEDYPYWAETNDFEKEIKKFLGFDDNTNNSSRFDLMNIE